MGLRKFFEKLADKYGDDIIGCDSGKGSKSRKDGFLESVECGVFTLDFYYDEEKPENCKVEIHGGVQMDVTLTAYHDGYGFLMSCRQDGAKDAMEAYCGMLWQCSYLLATDSYFPKRVGQSWRKFHRSAEKRAQTAAAAVTDEQEEADEALMSEAVRIADMSEDARAAYHNEVAGRLADILDEKDKTKSKK